MIDNMIAQLSPLKASGGHHTYLYTPQGLGAKSKRENWIWKTYDPLRMDSDSSRPSTDSSESSQDSKNSSLVASRTSSASSSSTTKSRQACGVNTIKHSQHKHTRSQETQSAGPWAAAFSLSAPTFEHRNKHLSLLASPKTQTMQVPSSDMRAPRSPTLRRKPLPALPATAGHRSIALSAKNATPRASTESKRQKLSSTGPTAPAITNLSSSCVCSLFDLSMHMTWPEEKKEQQQRLQSSLRSVSGTISKAAGFGRSSQSLKRSRKPSPILPSALFPSINNMTGSEQHLMTPPMTPSAKTSEAINVNTANLPTQTLPTAPVSPVSPLLIIQHPGDEKNTTDVSPIEASETEPTFRPTFDFSSKTKTAHKSLLVELDPLAPPPLKLQQVEKTAVPELQIPTISAMAQISPMHMAPTTPAAKAITFTAAEQHEEEIRRIHNLRTFRLAPAPTRHTKRTHPQPALNVGIQRSQSARTPKQARFPRATTGVRETWLDMAPVQTAETRPVFTSPVMVVGKAKLIKC